jgi:hypothetical protein
MIVFPGLDFSTVKDPIKTEETIYNQIKDIKLPVEYVGILIAYSINTQGVEKTQDVINDINEKYPFQKLFVCQHIYVNRLNFGDNLVFTPHTEESDNYFFIPHFNPIANDKPPRVNYQDRNLDFSFIGDFGTNPVRERISTLNSEKTPILSTGKWFFSYEEEKQRSLLEVYLKTLKDSKMSICPMGTGPSTLRLFESMSVGSIPIIFNNLKLPKEIKEIIKIIGVNDFIENPETHIICDTKGDMISKDIYEIYWEKLSNNNLYKSIIVTLKENGY